jgi:deazaflavin-dependent oxidoreductase (nitroreductase family)
VTVPDFQYDRANLFQRLMRSSASNPVTARFFARTLYKLDKPILRRSGGKRSLTTWLTGMPVVELTTTGARSGQPRTMPIVGVPDGDRLVLVASNYGQERNPAWYYNLKANPRCSIAFRGQQQDMRAYEAEGTERQRLWELDLTVYPTRARYAQWAAHRPIPVMVLEPVTESPRGG